MEIEFTVIVILSVVSLLAGFIDAIAGGGGLLVLPSLILAGLPPHVTLGTNKFINTPGTAIAVFNFMRKKKTSLKIILSGILFALGGAAIGSKAILLFDPNLVGKIIIFLLPVGIFATLYPKKNSTRKEHLTSRDLFLKTPLICTVIGFYDGFFGPGTGSFLALSFYLLLKLNLVEATANAKVFNFLSNLGALVVFITGGKVLYLIGIPLALTNMLGNYIGSHLAIKKGDKIIKLFLIIVLIILLVTLIVKYY